MDTSQVAGSADPALDPISERPEPRLSATERIRRGLTAFLTRFGPVLFTVDGVLVAVAGVSAILGSVGAFQGEGFLLIVGGLALVLFGLMMIIRWNLTAVRTGLIGLTAGYFASALSEFEVATDPCDIGAKLERCVGDPVLGTPWIVYQGPLIVAMLLFVFIALEPFVTERASNQVERLGGGPTIER